MPNRFIAILLLITTFVPGVALGHQYQGMSTQIVVQPNVTHAVMHIVAPDAILISPTIDRNKDARLSREEFNLSKALLAIDVANQLSISSDGTSVTLAKAEVDVSQTEGFTDEPHELKFTITYDAPGGSFGRVYIDPNLFRDISASPITGTAVVESMRNTVTIVDRGNRVTLQATGEQTYISPATETAQGESTGTQTVDEVASTDGTGKASSAGTSTGKLMLEFLWQGIVHILLGWDHVLFVIGLLLLASSLRSLVQVITAFTIAHSITLIIASLDLLQIERPQIVEAVIAASLAYIGIENLLRLDKPVQWRWILVFAFGLIHGLGFAGVLADLLGGEIAAAGKGELVACLLTFNVGVELGQLLIILLLYPTLQWLRRNNPKAARRVVIAGSCVVLFMGVSFLLDRTVIPGKLFWVEWFNG